MIDADPAALALGVRRGIPLGSAHRLAPEAAFLDPEPDEDAASVEAAFEILARFSPGLAGVSDQADPAFGLLEVQVDGLERLWGPEPDVVSRLVAALAGTLPGSPRPGIAGTRFAATIAAGNATPAEPRIVRAGGEAPFLAPLPASLLSQDQDVRDRLRRFGLRQIGAVAELPRSALVARFGAEGELLHDRARGVEVNPFRPRRAPERLALRLPIEPAVAELDSLRFVLHRLAGTLADQLEARGTAAARGYLRLALDVTFAPRGTPPELAVEQRFPEPTSDAEAIERLLFARLERTPPPAPVVSVELELAGVEPAVGQQLPLFVPQAARNARLGWQLARLALTFGEGRVRRAAIADPDAPLAESRWTWRP
ncbi:MAG TPA: DNA polymerase Y family protein [Candidatus Limnocylindrales bacterium]|nr:DNA polymerase Y family protein [Candidatus Limnocylindrales bacterium]